MGRLSELLALAGARGEKLGLPYSGALTPTEACEVWRLAPGARLIDLRTRAELEWVGRVPGAIEIEWSTWPEAERNPNFLAQLRHQVDPEALVLFLCRSGARSHYAALFAQQGGYATCYNILEGFEGERDAHGQRGHIGGWRFAGLPWMQA